MCKDTNMQKIPIVSVIIPTYNCARFLPEAIESVFGQTFNDFEILIVDDGSKDNTRCVVEKYIRENKGQITYFYQNNQGASSARNKGILEAKSEYIAFLDADDVFCNEYLEEMLREIRKGFDWVVCDNYREEIDIRTGFGKRGIVRRELDGCDKNDYLKKFLIKDRVGSPNKILVKRGSLISKKILFDYNLKSREDYDFCLQLLKNNLVLGWLKKPLVTYRIRNDGSNSTRKSGYSWTDYTFKLLKKYQNDYKQQGLKQTLSNHYYDLSRHFYYNSDIKMATVCLLNAVRWGNIGNLFTTIINKFYKIIKS